MPSVSAAQHRLMAMAAAGKSSKVPQSVGAEFMEADKGVSDMESPAEDRKEAKRPSKTHRGRRSRSAHSLRVGISDGMEPASVAPATDHHSDAKHHMENAMQAKAPNVAFKHLMKAVKAMHKAKTM